MSKFVVIRILNPDIDACSHNEAGVATMSTSTGGPLVFAEPGIYNTREAAFKKMEEVIAREMAEWNDYGCANGWQFEYMYGNHVGYIVVNNGQYDAGYVEYHLEAFDVLEIEEV